MNFRLPCNSSSFKSRRYFTRKVSYISYVTKAIFHCSNHLTNFSIRLQFLVAIKVLLLRKFSFLKGYKQLLPKKKRCLLNRKIVRSEDWDYNDSNKRSWGFVAYFFLFWCIVEITFKNFLRTGLFLKCLKNDLGPIREFHFLDNVVLKNKVISKIFSTMRVLMIKKAPKSDDVFNTYTTSASLHLPLIKFKFEFSLEKREQKYITHDWKLIFLSWHVTLILEMEIMKKIAKDYSPVTVESMTGEILI